MKYDSFLYNSNTYTLAALVIGYILIQELSVNDAIAQAIQNRIKASENSDESNNNTSSEAIINCLKEDKKTINELKEMIKKIEKRLDELSR